MNAPESQAAIGHNKAPLAEILGERYAEAASKVEALAQRATAAPRKITSEQDLEVVGSIVKDAGELSRSIDKDRKREKEPHLQAGRDVDAFFGIFTARLDRIREVFQRAADDHARAKAEEIRRKAIEDARKARDEADRQAEIARRAEEANRPKSAEKHEAKAEAAIVIAEQAEAVASLGAADLTRQRLGSGMLSSAKTEMTFEVTGYAAIPLNDLRPYLKREHVEQAIRAFVKFHSDKTPLPGVRIFADVKATFR